MTTTPRPGAECKDGFIPCPDGAHFNEFYFEDLTGECLRMNSKDLQHLREYKICGNYKDKQECEKGKEYCFKTLHCKYVRINSM